jgi:DNA-binding transcriptional regulator YiaG
MQRVELKEEGITKSTYASKMGLTEEAVDNWEEPDA